MKHNLKLLFVLLGIAIAFATCSKGGVEPENPQPPQPPQPAVSITIPATENVTPSFSDDGGASTVSFTVNASWSAKVVEAAATWCTVSPASGASGSHTITINCTKNDTPDSRSATVQLTAGTVTKTIKVSQKQKNALTVTSNRFEIPAEGGSVDIEAKANVELSYTIAESAKGWISYVETKALKTSHLVFKIAANEGTAAREAKITVSGGGISEEITVVQAAKVPAEFKISQTEFKVGAEKSTFEITITSSIGYQVKPDVDWIKETSKKGGDGVYTHTFEVAENTSSDAREGVVVVCNDDQVCIPVTVKQAAKNTLLVTKTRFEVPAEGGSVDIEAKANVELSYTIAESAKGWISYVETKALKTSHLVFKVAANEGTAAREAKITVSGGGISEEITVVQAAKVPAEFKISQNEFKVGAEKSTFEITITSSIGYQVKPEVDWIKETSKSGSNGVYTHKFEVAENTSTDARKGVIVVCNDEQVCIPVTVEQAAKVPAEFKISQKEFKVGAEKSTFEITITSSIGYQVKPEVDWVKETSKSGSNGVYTHKFEVAENTSTDARKGVIVVCNDEQVCIPVTVEQAAKVPAEFKISQTEFKVGADKSTFEITITSSIGYQVKPDVDWVKETSKSGSNGVYTHKFEVAENTSADARKGVIVVCNDEQVCIPVTVEQAGAEPQEDASWVSKEFFHKSLGMRFTADWCGYCPMMATALDDAKAQLSGNLEVLSLHASGGLYSAASDALAQQYKVQGFPTGYVDGRVQISNYSQTSVTTSKIVEAVKETEAKFETVTGASWESSVSGNKINLDLMVYFKKAGYYKVTALLVEDNIVAYQAGASNSYNHKDVVRGAFSNAEGAPMTITQDGSKRKYTYSMDIPSGCKKENLRIVVYIQERQSNSLYYVNNAASAAVGKQQPLLVKINNTGDVEGIVPGDKITF